MRRIAPVVVAVAALLLAGCGGNEVSGPRDTSPVATVESTTSPAVEPSPTTRRRRLEYQPGVYLSLIEPAPCTDGPRPVIVTLSGLFAEEFAVRGYLGVVVEARNPGYEPRFDDQMVRAVGSVVHDMAIAVQWLRAHDDEYCVESDAIAATGHSFDAIAALALAYSEGESPGQVTIDEFGTTVTAQPIDFGSVPAELTPYSNDLDAVVSFSGFALAEHIDRGEPPAILFHGRNDTTVPFSLAESTCAAAEAVGVTCELVPHDAGHEAAPDLSVALDLATEFLDREMLAPSGLADDT